MRSPEGLAELLRAAESKLGWRSAAPPRVPGGHVQAPGLEEGLEARHLRPEAREARRLHPEVRADLRNPADRAQGSSPVGRSAACDLLVLAS